MNTISLQKLKIINEVIECKSAYKAASRLNISPAAISYTIKTLREKIGSELFIRTKCGLRPNDIALALQDRYRELTVFNTKRKEYFIATYSLIELLLTDSINTLESGSLLHFITMDESDDERLRKLKQREVDIDIGGGLPYDISIVSKKYLHSDIAILVNKNHPTIGDEFTLKDWCNNTHIRWRRDIGSITSMLNGINPEHHVLFNREISWESPNLLTMAYVCANGDSIMIIPEAFVDLLKKRFPLKSFSLPTEMEMKFECYIHYHRSLKIELNNVDLKFV